MPLLKLILVLAVIFSCGSYSLAQDAPIFSQFPLNPFQFNPSYAAHQGHAEANLFYRKQWMGVENAPEVGAFNIQAPVGRNVSFGFMFLSNKTVILNTTSTLATFGYRVRLGYYHHLNFGLSGGIAMNNFDLEAVANANDPALNNVVQKSTYVDGQAGINYQFKNFNIGFALPKLFNSTPNSETEFQEVEFNAFRNKFGSVAYNFNVGNVQVSPTVIYRAIDKKKDQWEGMVLATYKSFLWIGASYRDGYGITGLIGVKLKGLLRIGYAYEHPTTSISEASNGSHELYLGMPLGHRDREEEYFLEKRNKDSLAQVAATKKEVAATEKEVAEEKVEEKPIVTEEAKVIVAAPIVAATIPAKEEEPVTKEPEEEPANYYVVLGAYRNQKNALNQMKALQDRSMLPEMLYVLDKKYYYIYTFKSNDRKSALEELSKERAKNRFPDVWIYRAPIEK